MRHYKKLITLRLRTQKGEHFFKDAAKLCCGIPSFEPARGPRSWPDPNSVRSGHSVAPADSQSGHVMYWSSSQKHEYTSYARGDGGDVRTDSIGRRAPNPTVLLFS